MFRLLPDLPAHVVAFEADGTVTRPDVEALFREINAALARGPIHLVGEVNGIGGLTLDALRENAARSAGLLTKLAKLRRVALVTDDAWIRGIAQAQGALLPTAVRVFARAERAAALAWTSEPVAA